MSIRVIGGHFLSQINVGSFPSRNAPGTRTGWEWVNTFGSHPNTSSPAFSRLSRILLRGTSKQPCNNFPAAESMGAVYTCSSFSFALDPAQRMTRDRRLLTVSEDLIHEATTA